LKFEYESIGTVRLCMWMSYGS